MADQEGFGFLYPQKDRLSDRHPAMTGHVIVEGRKIELAAWPKTAKSGVRYLSLKGGDKGPAEEDQPTAQTTMGDEDGLPF